MNEFIENLYAFEPIIKFVIGFEIGLSLVIAIFRLIFSTFDEKCDDKKAVPLTQVEQDRIAWWGR
jgi:hypothetical protein